MVNATLEKRRRGVGRRACGLRQSKKNEKEIIKWRYIDDQWVGGQTLVLNASDARICARLRQNNTWPQQEPQKALECNRGWDLKSESGRTPTLPKQSLQEWDWARPDTSS